MEMTRKEIFQNFRFLIEAFAYIEKRIYKEIVSIFFCVVYPYIIITS